MTNHEKSPSAALLEEVFNELEMLEVSKESNTSRSGFLEDLINLEKEMISGKKKNKILQNANFCGNLTESKSEIHEGLTDSSEDEDNRYFEERKYSECGRIIKNLIKEKPSSAHRSLDYTAELVSKELSKSEGEHLKKQLEKFGNCTKEKQQPLQDPILGMHIINPLISSTSLKEKLIGRVSISTLKLKSFLETPASRESNWVTGGAIVYKMTRTSQKGNQYCVWHLTDLKGDIKTVCVFLFGSAYKEYWKTCLGAVVGILNPTVMDNKDKSEATLRVDNAEKILLIGTSKDYGLCKSKKKNGENCLSVVNKAKCDYCVYHMKKEYNKACRRSDLQPPKIGRSFDNLRTKIFGKNQVFYNGRTYTGTTDKKKVTTTERDEQRLKLLSQKIQAPLNKSREQKDESILKMLSTNPEPVPIKGKQKTTSKPELELIDLEFTITRKERNAARANALKYVRQHGPIKRCSENAKKTPEQISSLKRKLEAEDEKEDKRAKTKNDAPLDPSKQKYLKNGITEEFLKLMQSETRNKELLKAAEEIETEKYFNKLEMKEKIENKMASTFKVECKAIRCLKCNYKSFSASELCKKEKHPLKVVSAIKRFWKCGNCSGRTVCLELIPLHSCRVCGSSKWERASMMREKKDCNLVVQRLSLRGDEEAFVGAAIKEANLNLLVPEESS